MRWKDTTIRSRGNEDKPANCWTLRTAAIEITVLNGHLQYPGSWVLVCHQLNISTMVLPVPFDAPLEDAKNTALATVKSRLLQMLNSLNISPIKF